MKNIVVGLISICLFLSCNPPVTVGDEILEGEFIKTGETGGLRVKVKTLSQDSVKVYTGSGLTTGSHFLGNIEDPLLGRYSADLFVEYYLESQTYKFSDTITVDSVIVSMAVDTSELYGEIKDVTMDILAYRLDNQIDGTKEYFSDANFQTIPFPITNLSAYPIKIRDHMDVISNEEGELDTVMAYVNVIRFPLDKSVGEYIVSLPENVLADNDNFVKLFSGIKYVGRTKNSLLALKTKLNFSNIAIYYHEKGVQKIAYLRSFTTNPTINTFKKDISVGSFAGKYNDYTVGDSIIMVGGMNGPIAQIDFENLDILQGKIINYAEMKIYGFAEPEIDTLIYPVLESLAMLYDNKDGERVPVEDLESGLLAQSKDQIELSFGGEALRDGNIFSYSMNFTSFAQKLVDDPGINSIYLIALYKVSQSERVQLYGVNHSQYPIEIKIYYTE